MALNIITINFEVCEPTPEDGYIIKYKPVGDPGPYRDAPGNPYTLSPVVINDTLDEGGTQYEGIIQSDCGEEIGLGEEVPWTTVE